MQNYEGLLRAKIVGYETQINQIIDKWQIGEHDKEKINNLIAHIEADTIKYADEVRSNQEYCKKNGIRYRRAK